MGNFIFPKVPANIDFYRILCLFWRLARNWGVTFLLK